MPVQLFPDDSQQPDLGVSGESNFWHDGYSYRQDNKEKGYTIIDGGSTGSGANLSLPHFLECGVDQCCLTPNFYMHKSMVGSLFVKALNVTVVFLRKNAPNFGISHSHG